MPSEAVDLVLKYKHYLTFQQLKQIRDEIQREISIHEELGESLGDPCDHVTWKNAVIKLDHELRKGATLGP